MLKKSNANIVAKRFILIVITVIIVKLTNILIDLSPSSRRIDILRLDSEIERRNRDAAHTREFLLNCKKKHHRTPKEKVQ